MLYKEKIKFIFFGLFLFQAILLVNSCNEEGYDCDVCGDPDKAYYVNIVDTLGRPISNLNIIVKDGCGNILYVPQNPIAEATGQYTLVDDELLDFQSILQNCNYNILFSATDGTKTLDTNFTFRVGTDGLCYCEFPRISIIDYKDIPILVFK